MKWYDLSEKEVSIFGNTTLEKLRRGYILFGEILVECNNNANKAEGIKELLLMSGFAKHNDSKRGF